MAILHTGLTKPLAEPYDIPYSCRFNDDDSAYLSKTFGAAGNNKKYTVAFWCKRANLGTYQNMFSPYTGSSNNLQISWDASTGNKIEFYMYSGGFIWNIVTTQLFRDPSAWYHIVIVYDSAQVTDTNRIKIFVNGTQVTVFDTAAYPAQDVSGVLLDSTALQIGAKNGASFFDGYLAEVHVLDNTAVTDASDFGERGDYGEWKPIEVKGLTYGTNGFYLDFADAADLGDDESGEGNDFAETNITASDQMLDSPTNNFCTLNPLNNGSSVSEGSLKSVCGENQATASTMAVPSSGKFYWEALVVSESGIHINLGIVSAEQVGTLNVGDVSTFNAFASAGHRIYIDSGYKAGSTAAASHTPYGASWTTGDIIGVAVDMDAPSLTFYKNNSTQGVSHTDISLQTWIPIFASYSGTVTFVANFGQDGTFAGEKTAQGNADGNGYGNFYYAPPSSHLALCSKNLTDCAVTPSEHFNTITYDDGAGAKTGVGFQPDLVWLKSRGSAYEHEWTDAVRGVTEALSCDSSNAESTDSTGLTAFGSDGFTVGADTNYSDTTGDGMVAWNWKAGGAGSANTDGDMAETVTVSANQNAGFSIVKYIGDGSAATVGHGLSAAPELIMVKNIDQADAWQVYHADNTSAPETDYMVLDTTAATSDAADRWNDTAPTSSVFTIGDAVEVNTDDENYIAYCFHSVDGFSKIGSYTGNANADGTFIYTGFAPAYVIRKRTNGANAWPINDTARNPYNLANYVVLANTSAADTSADNEIDFLSNGFKLRATDTHGNASGGIYLYMAFAATPFKNANAR